VIIKTVKPKTRPTDFGREYFERTFSNVENDGIDESPIAIVK